MSSSRSALKFDLFAADARQRKSESLGGSLQIIARHIDSAHLAGLVDALCCVTAGAGVCPACGVWACPSWHRLREDGWLMRPTVLRHKLLGSVLRSVAPMASSRSC